MTYQGHVENGAVVFDTPETPPEGAKVQVAIASPEAPQEEKPLWQRIVEIGASVPLEEWEHLPKDGSINLDHYLYGAPKREE